MKRFIKLFFISLILMGIHFNPSYAKDLYPNAPILIEGMERIKWVNGNETLVADNDLLGWYNYDKNRWANVKDDKGNYWIWIPRFTYKFEENEVLIKWSNGVKDDTADGYKVHPAFISEAYVGGNPNEFSNYINLSESNQLTGFWVAKYLASSKDGNISIAPDKVPDTYKNIGEAFEACLGIKSDSGVSSHLIKASEFGAVAYLTNACGSDPDANESGKTGKDKQYSNTNNYYGVFDLKGPVDEYLAAFVVKDGVINPTAYDKVGKMDDSEYARFVDTIKLNAADNEDNNKERFGEFYGFAMSETENFDSVDEVIPAGDSPFFSKGGKDTGVYSYGKSSGTGLGFRPTISVYTSYVPEETTFFDTEASVVAGDHLVLSVNFSVDKNWKFPLNPGEVIIDKSTGAVVDKTRLFDFIDLRYVQSDGITEYYNLELNEELIGIIEDRTPITELDDTTEFKANKQYTIRVRVGGVNSEGDPVFSAIPGTEAKIIVESIDIKDCDSNERLKIAKIPNNKVRLSVYDPNPLELTEVILYIAPNKVKYFQNEPLDLNGGILRVWYGSTYGDIRLGTEHVPNYEDATSEIGDDQFIPLIYKYVDKNNEIKEKVVRQKVSEDETDIDRFVINVTGKAYEVTGSVSPDKTARIEKGTGLCEVGKTVLLGGNVNPGYKFDIWSSPDEIVIYNASSLNDAYFIMPEKDVHVTLNTIGVQKLEVFDAKVEFELGEPFSLGEGWLKATYFDGVTETPLYLESPGVSSEPASGQKFERLGTHEVVIRYGGAEVRYDVNVVNKKHKLTIVVDPSEGGHVEKDGKVIVPIDGNNKVELMVPYDALVELTAVENTGYAFDRWTDAKLTDAIDNNSVTGERIGFRMPAQDVHLTAYFVKAYKVEYLVECETCGSDKDCGHIDGFNPQYIKHGGTTSKVTAVANEGHAFKEWSDGKMQLERIDSPIVKDVTYTAIFDKQWTVKYYVDGLLWAEKTFFHGEDGNILGPNQKGRFFDRWDKDEELKCITGDIETNAVYEDVISIEPNGNFEPSDFVTAIIKGNGIKAGTLEYIISHSPTDTGENMSDYVTKGVFTIDDDVWVTDVDENGKKIYRSTPQLQSKQDASSKITIDTGNDKELIKFDYMLSVEEDQLLGITINGNRITEFDDRRNEWLSFEEEVPTVDGEIVIGISYSQDEIYAEGDYAAIKGLSVGRAWIPITSPYDLNDNAIWKYNYVHIRGQVADSARYGDLNEDLYPNGMHQIVSNVFVGNSEDVGDLYTIKYELNGGMAVGNPNSYTAESDDITLNEPTKLGSKFIGWTGSNGSIPSKVVIIPKGSTGNKRYIANWEKNKYTVTWENWDGEVLKEDSLLYGSIPSYDGKVPTKLSDGENEYTFKGWRPAISPVTGDVTYTAEFIMTENADNYTITATAGTGGTITPSGTITVQAGASQSFRISPEEDHEVVEVKVDGNAVETFLIYENGVDINQDGSENSDDGALVESYIKGNATLTEQQKLMADFDGDGTIDGSDSHGIFLHTMLPDDYPNTRVRDRGYIFTNVTSDHTITASFAQVQAYTVTWVNWNGTVLETDYNVAYGTWPSFDQPNPTRDATAQCSYVFVGWSPDGEEVTKDVTYTALFDEVENEYTVTFNKNGGSGTMSSQSFTAGVAQKLFKNTFTYSGHTFSSWNTKADGSGTRYTDQQSISISSNITLYAQWRTNNYTITATAGTGGTITPSGTITVQAGASQSFRISPEEDHEVVEVKVDGNAVETFLIYENGVDINQDGSENIDDATLVNNYIYGNATLTEQQKLMADFNGDGTIDKSDAVAINMHTMLPYDYPNTRAQDRGIIFTNVTSDHTITASFSQVQAYTVTWVNWNGTVLETDYNVAYGTWPSFDQPNPTRDATAQCSYVFVGWSPDGEEVTKDVTYTALFDEVENEYTVTFNKNGGSGTMSSQRFTAGVTQKLFKNTFTYSGHTFSSWNTKADGSGTRYTDQQSISISSNITLYAQWSDNPSITVSKTNYSGTYDGSAHTFTLTTNPSSNVTIYYSTSRALTSSNYTAYGTTNKPSRTELGTTTVYYYVHDTSGNYIDYSSNDNSNNATITITGKSISGFTATLSNTSYTYDGIAKKPGVTVKNGSTTLTNGTDYTVSYSNNINAGTATATITGIGNYSGTINKNFTITKAEGYITLKYTHGNIEGDTDYTIVESCHGGEISADADNYYVDVEVDGMRIDISNLSYVDAHENIEITITSEETQNYTSASTTYNIYISRHDYIYSDYNSSYHWQYCSCGVTTDKYAHRKDETSRTNATCTTDGRIYYRCETDYCGYTTEERIDSTGHKWGDWKTTKAATCAATGVRTSTCTVSGCNATKTEVIPKLTTHKFDDEGVVTKAATCVSTGVRTYTCTVSGCNATYTGTIAKTGHSFGTYRCDTLHAYASPQWGYCQKGDHYWEKYYHSVCSNCNATEYSETGKPIYWCYTHLWSERLSKPCPNK